MLHYIILWIFLIFFGGFSAIEASEKKANVTVTRKKEGLSIVFAYGMNISYGVNPGRESIEIVFDTQQPFDVKTLEKGLPKGFGVQSVKDKKGILSLILKTPPRTLASHERNDSGILLTFLPGKAPPEQDQALQELPDLKEKDAGENKKAKIPPEKALPKAEPKPQEELIITSSEDGVELKFIFQNAPPALVTYQSESRLYIAFDRLIKPKVTGSVSYEIATLKNNDQGNTSLFSVFFVLGVAYYVEKLPDGWKVFIDIIQNYPRQYNFQNLPFRFVSQPDGKTVLKLPLPEKPKFSWINDPITGQPTLIVPLYAEGYGIRDKHDYIDFQIVPSRQGVAILKNSTDLECQFDGSSLTISRPQGLLVSSEEDRSRTRTLVNTVSLYDFKSWKREKEPFSSAEKYFQDQIRSLPSGKKSVAYLDLIRLNMAYGRFVEAIGLLRLADEEDPRLKYDITFHALRGVSRLLVGDGQLALEDLTYHDLAKEAEVKLWQGLALCSLKKYDEGLHLIQDKMNFIAQYPDPFFTMLTFKSVQCALEGKNIPLAEKSLALLKNSKLSPLDMGEYTLYSAKIADAKKDRGSAINQLEKARKSGDSKVAAFAELDLTLKNLEKKDITSEEAIKKLEDLRYRWKSDEFEITIGRTLAQLYIQKKAYKKGLDLLTSLIALYPKDPAIPDIQKYAAQTFSSVFLSPEGKNFPALTAVSLYQTFKELTPKGEVGDKLVLEIVDRLLALDLPSQAVGILEDRMKASETVSFALGKKLVEARFKEGGESAAQLTIDLLLSQSLDEANRLDLRRMKADLMIKNSQYEDALNLLEKDESYEGLLKKAEIYTQKKLYPEAAVAIIQALGQKKPSELSSRIVLTAALYLNRAQDWQGLQNLNEKYAHVIQDPQEKTALEILVKNHEESASLDHLDQELKEVDDFESLLKTASDKKTLKND